MGIFKRRKEDEAFKIQLEREAIDRMNNKGNTDFTLPLTLEGDDSIWNIGGKAKAPHTITADELRGTTTPTSSATPDKKESVSSIPMSETRENQTASSFLYKKMTEARQQSLESVVSLQNSAENKVIEVTNPVTEEPFVSQTKKQDKTSEQKSGDVTPTQNTTPETEKLDIEAMIRSLKELTNSNNSTENNPKSDASTPEEIPTTKKQDLSSDKSTNVDNNSSDNIPPAIDPQKAKLTEQRRTSLLARCNAFLEDDEVGTVKIDTEKYKLESVESILKGFEERASQRVTKSYTTNSVQGKTATSTTENVINEKPFVIKTETESELTTQPQEIIENTNEQIDKTQIIDLDKQQITEPAPVKHYFTAPVQPKAKSENNEDANIGATKVMSDTEIEKITLSSNAPTERTSIFDALNLPKPEEKQKFEQFEKKETSSKPNDEQTNSFPNDYNSVNDKNRVMGELVSKRKSASVKAALNLLLLIPAILLLTPIISSLTTINPLLPFALEFAISLIALIVNFDAVKSIITLFKDSANPKAASGIAVLGVLLFSVVQLISKGEFISVSSLLLISLLFNAFSDRNHFNIAISNFNLIADSNNKKAVAIIKNKAATEAMVGNSIEGGSLVCCGADTVNVKNFLKYTYCGNPVAKKIKSISAFGFVLSIVILIITLLFTDNEIASALLYFCIALCITSTPATLSTSRLPFKIANSRLKLYDSMLTGYRAADELDLCNGVAVSCNDLFPEGTIRLVDMKLLSPNPIDQSMIDAAALADAMGSPIAGIFKQVSTASSYTQKPLKVDSFVYENKMGISGWVDDRRVFVGNRILMEAHGFTNLPPIELDKKIMRKGYFPVYLVSDNVPCALLIVKYAPDEEIVYELRRLCNTGTTVLIHNCDPNISEQMICDYFGLYSESVYVMSKQGSQAYEDIINPRKEISAGAAYKGNVCGLFATLTASINVKRSISFMTALYVVFVVLGLFALAVLLFTPLLANINTVVAIIFQFVTTLLISLPPLIKRP